MYNKELKHNDKKDYDVLKDAMRKELENFYWGWCKPIVG